LPSSQIIGDRSRPNLTAKSSVWITDCDFLRLVLPGAVATTLSYSRRQSIQAIRGNPHNPIGRSCAAVFESRRNYGAGFGPQQRWRRL